MKRLSTLLLTCLLLSGCMLEFECANEPTEEIASPDGSKKMVLFSRDCGATTGFNTQCSILANSEPLPDERGNVFVIDNGTAKVTWVDDSSVLVTFEADVRIFRQESAVGGVEVEYRSN